MWPPCSPGTVRVTRFVELLAQMYSAKLRERLTRTPASVPQLSDALGAVNETSGFAFSGSGFGGFGFDRTAPNLNCPLRPAQHQSFAGS